MRNLVLLLFFQFVVLLLPSAIFAQKTNPKVSVKDTSKNLEVRLPLTITDKKKNLVICQDKKEKKEKKVKKKEVSCFKKGDFVVLEDGVRQKITSFTNVKNNLPVYVGVLMDTSPSTAGKTAFFKRATGDFLYTVVRLRKDRAAFMTFDNEISLIQDFTNKVDLLDAGVDKVKKVGSQTALYDAIWSFCDEKLRNVAGRRVIVLIADSDDTISRADLNDAIDIAQRTETTIFVISTKDASLSNVEAGQIKDEGDNYLRRLSEETGGELFFTSDLSALERAFKKISEELRSHYVIKYRPANQDYDGRIRKIEVRFKKKSKADKYKIHSKTDYRAVKVN